MGSEEEGVNLRGRNSRGREFLSSRHDRVA
jgi:hypothetical protein